MITITYKNTDDCDGYGFNTGRFPASAILSFDIGIINLAYCIISENPNGVSGSKYNIHEWQIINLLDSRKTCNVILKSGINKGLPCKNIAGYKVDQKYYCLTHGKDKGYKKFNQNAGNSANVSDNGLKLKLFQELDKRKHFLDIKTVIIEIQHKKATERVKNIGTAINDYFVLRGIMDAGKDMLFKSIDAKNKLTVYDGPIISCNIKDPHARNKWYGIRYCAWAIRGMKEQSKYFANFPQKTDDLADSMLQGAWYLTYGSHGKKGMLSTQQKQLVYSGSNIIKYKKIKRNVKPKPDATRLTLPNIRYLVGRYKDIQEIRKDKVLSDSISFFFGTIDYFIEKISS